MQPYIYPYIGYFQLINSVDKFVVLDDVNYINKGWINRNAILINGQANLFTLPLKEASQNKKINDIELLDDQKWKVKLIKTIEQNYKKSPCFEKVFPLIEQALNTNENNVSRFNVIQLKMVCDYLEIKTEIIPTSSSFKLHELTGQSRIINICKELNAKIYINPIGGVSLYDQTNFEKSSLELFFLKSDMINYNQFKNDFTPWLSIIDIMMFNPKELILDFLEKYTLLSNG